LPGLRSLRNRLAVIFALIILGAIGTIYLSVTPRLEASLTSQRLDQVSRTSQQLTPGLFQYLPQLDRPVPSKKAKAAKDKRDRSVRKFAERANTEVIVMSLGDAGPYQLTDSTPDGGVTSRDVQGVTRQARRTGRQASAIVTSRAGREAVAAMRIPDPEKELDGAYVAVFADSLADVEDNVALIRRQVLISGAIALVIAVLAGYLVARALAARVKRLERAARKVASGDFSQPIRADSDDELGRLAAAFDDMQSQLARLDRARKQFIANASHELRTPIFSLGGFVELLQDEDIDEETRREFLDTMGEQVERLQKLAVDLLDLSRLDAGSVAFDCEDVDLAVLAAEIAGEFRPAIAQREAQLDLQLSDDPVGAVCDRERVAQIMRILLDNALRHTPEGTHVTVTAAPNNGHAEFAVSDSGPGVPEVAREQLFERFYTGDKARGSGLGLAIARELAERMDGRIALASQPGETTFSLELPAADDDGDLA
jgi:two-component system OmpR family sensor kinase